MNNGYNDDVNNEVVILEPEGDDEEPQTTPCDNRVDNGKSARLPEQATESFADLFSEFLASEVAKEDALPKAIQLRGLTTPERFKEVAYVLRNVSIYLDMYLYGLTNETSLYEKLKQLADTLHQARRIFSSANGKLTRKIFEQLESLKQSIFRGTFSFDPETEITNQQNQQTLINNLTLAPVYLEAFIAAERDTDEYQKISDELGDFLALLQMSRKDFEGTIAFLSTPDGECLFPKVQVSLEEKIFHAIRYITEYDNLASDHLDSEIFPLLREKLNQLLEILDKYVSDKIIDHQELINTLKSCNDAILNLILDFRQMIEPERMSYLPAPKRAFDFLEMIE